MTTSFSSLGHAPPRSGRIALVTYEPAPAINSDDMLLERPLAALGYRIEGVPWSDSAANWNGYDAVVLRSSWDYHKHAARFVSWLEKLRDGGVCVLNSVPICLWNADKRYLLDLAARGVSTIPTRIFHNAADTELADVLEAEHWNEAVVKPVVSASARGTWRTGLATAEDDAAAFTAQLRTEPVMVQPFLRDIMRDGEISLLFFDGRYSHSVRKRPAPGDFRVQVEYGGSVERITSPDAVIADALAAVECAPGKTVYARVDGCMIDGKFTLMELELLEPGLFLQFGDGAAERFANAIVGAIASRVA